MQRQNIFIHDNPLLSCIIRGIRPPDGKSSLGSVRVRGGGREEGDQKG
jgi:hypothetical protein